MRAHVDAAVNTPTYQGLRKRSLSYESGSVDRLAGPNLFGCKNLAWKRIAEAFIGSSMSALPVTES
jgi:hypothetical protein